MELFFQLIINGIVIGAVYSLVSLGYALVFSLNINNFAHGTLVMIGSYASFLALEYFGIPLLLVFPILVTCGLILGASVYYLAIRPMAHLTSWSAVLASTLALAVILENFVLMVHGPQLFSLRNSIGMREVFDLRGVSFTQIQLLLVLISVALLLLLSRILNGTRLGIQFRAVADDSEAAEAMGISKRRLLLFALMLSGVFATIAGFLISCDYDQDASVGTSLLMKSYVVTIIGGAKNIKKVVFAAYFVGILENLVAGYISTEYSLASVFLLLIGFLILRRKGLRQLGLVREV